MSKGARTLVFERSRNHIFEDISSQSEEGQEVEEYSFLMKKVATRDKGKPDLIKNEGGILGVMGVLNIVGRNYLGVLTEAELVGEINKSSIYKVSKINLVPFT